ncbi:MAG: type II toxin-antitoxin system RelB/DinJ family antitoxin [Victivallales bacterium]
MRTATVRARIEPDLKEQAEHIFKKLGLLPSDAIRLLYHRTILSRGIPFEMKIPNRETLAAIAELRSKAVHKSFSSARKAFESLEND